jgi:NAD(P)H-dependent FMN reductase
MPARILAFSGSSRNGSINKKLLAIAVREGRALGADITEIDLRAFDLPIYDGDLDSGTLPPAAVKLQEIFMQHNALLICTPEYNGGVAPLLKNAIDWVSRPHADSPNLAAITGKTVSILSAAMGILGGARQQAQLRVSFQVMRTILVPETVNIPLAHNAFNEDGSLKDRATHDMVVLAVKSLKQIADKLNP